MLDQGVYAISGYSDFSEDVKNYMSQYKKYMFNCTCICICVVIKP